MTKGLRLEPKVLKRVTEILNVEILQSELPFNPLYGIFGAYTFQETDQVAGHN